MSLAELIPLLLKARILLTVFVLGLQATVDRVLYVLQRPALLTRSLLAMYVMMPIVAVALAVAFDFIPSVEIALLALAVSPVPPLLPKTECKAGGRAPKTPIGQKERFRPRRSMQVRVVVATLWLSAH